MVDKPIRRFLRLPDVMDRIPYSRPTIYRKIAEGKFPRPYDLDGPGGARRAVAWLESEIDAWIDERLNATREVR